ncbi:Hypothetical_protein [Hexamita inflata]|uniref:Hypothetical_protein n=1 Tax=Hexamita inflata TaxID=28002 RepID=A0AA86NPH9_9EUKA|nr:Hypothetical protein HINF_LOCUS10867 [Hexamita inflata]
MNQQFESVCTFLKKSTKEIHYNVSATYLIANEKPILILFSNEQEQVFIEKSYNLEQMYNLIEMISFCLNGNHSIKFNFRNGTFGLFVQCFQEISMPKLKFLQDLLNCATSVYIDFEIISQEHIIYVSSLLLSKTEQLNQLNCIGEKFLVQGDHPTDECILKRLNHHYFVTMPQNLEHIINVILDHRPSWITINDNEFHEIIGSTNLLEELVEFPKNLLERVAVQRIIEGKMITKVFYLLNRVFKRGGLMQEIILTGGMKSYLHQCELDKVIEQEKPKMKKGDEDEKKLEEMMTQIIEKFVIVPPEIDIIEIIINQIKYGQIIFNKDIRWNKELEKFKEDLGIMDIPNLRKIVKVDPSFIRKCFRNNWIESKLIKMPEHLYSFEVINGIYIKESKILKLIEDHQQRMKQVRTDVEINKNTNRNLTQQIFKQIQIQNETNNVQNQDSVSPDITTQQNNINSKCQIEESQIVNNSNITDKKVNIDNNFIKQASKQLLEQYTEQIQSNISQHDKLEQSAIFQEHSSILTQNSASNSLLYSNINKESVINNSKQLPWYINHKMNIDNVTIDAISKMMSIIENKFAMFPRQRDLQTIVEDIYYQNFNNIKQMQFGQQMAKIGLVQIEGFGEKAGINNNLLINYCLQHQICLQIHKVFFISKPINIINGVYIKNSLLDNYLKNAYKIKEPLHSQPTTQNDNSSINNINIKELTNTWYINWKQVNNLNTDIQQSIKNMMQRVQDYYIIVPQQNLDYLIKIIFKAQSTLSQLPIDKIKTEIGLLSPYDISQGAQINMESFRFSCFKRSISPNIQDVNIQSGTKVLPTRVVNGVFIKNSRIAQLISEELQMQLQNTDDRQFVQMMLKQQLEYKREQVIEQKLQQQIISNSNQTFNNNKTSQQDVQNNKSEQIINETNKISETNNQKVNETGNIIEKSNRPWYINGNNITDQLIEQEVVVMMEQIRQHFQILPEQPHLSMIIDNILNKDPNTQKLSALQQLNYVGLLLQYNIQSVLDNKELFVTACKQQLISPKFELILVKRQNITVVNGIYVKNSRISQSIALFLSSQLVSPSKNEIINKLNKVILLNQSISNQGQENKAQNMQPQIQKEITKVAETTNQKVNENEIQNLTNLDVPWYINSKNIVDQSVEQEVVSMMRKIEQHFIILPAQLHLSQIVKDILKNEYISNQFDHLMKMDYVGLLALLNIQDILDDRQSKLFVIACNKKYIHSYLEQIELGKNKYMTVNGIYAKNSRVAKIIGNYPTSKIILATEIQKQEHQINKNTHIDEQINKASTVPIQIEQAQNQQIITQNQLIQSKKAEPDVVSISDSESLGSISAASIQPKPVPKQQVPNFKALEVLNLVFETKRARAPFAKIFEITKVLRNALKINNDETREILIEHKMISISVKNEFLFAFLAENDVQNFDFGVKTGLNEEELADLKKLREIIGIKK